MAVGGLTGATRKSGYVVRLCRLARIPDHPALVGSEGFVQFFWRDPCGPSTWVASNGTPAGLRALVVLVVSDVASQTVTSEGEEIDGNDT